MSNEAWRLLNGEDRDERGHIRWRCEICKALGHAADECDQADCDTCLNAGLDNRGHWAGSPLCPAYSAKRRAIEAELLRSRRGEEAAAKAAGGGGGFADAKAADVDYAGAAIGGTDAEPLGIIPPPPVPPPEDLPWEVLEQLIASQPPRISFDAALKQGRDVHGLSAQDLLTFVEETRAFDRDCAALGGAVDASRGRLAPELRGRLSGIVTKSVLEVKRAIKGSRKKLKRLQTKMRRLEDAASAEESGRRMYQGAAADWRRAIKAVVQDPASRALDVAAAFTAIAENVAVGGEDAGWHKDGIVALARVCKEARGRAHGKQEGWTPDIALALRDALKATAGMYSSSGGSGGGSGGSGGGGGGDPTRCSACRQLRDMKVRFPEAWKTSPRRLTLALRNPCLCGLLVCGACRTAHKDTCTYDYRGCYDCGQTGHISRDCPDYGCFNCGEEDHITRECPYHLGTMEVKDGDGGDGGDSGDNDDHGEPPPPSALQRQLSDEGKQLLAHALA